MVNMENIPAAWCLHYSRREHNKHREANGWFSVLALAAFYTAGLFLYLATLVFTYLQNCPRYSSLAVRFQFPLLVPFHLLNFIIVKCSWAVFFASLMIVCITMSLNTLSTLTTVWVGFQLSLLPRFPDSLSNCLLPISYSLSPRPSIFVTGLEKPLS